MPTIDLSDGYVLRSLAPADAGALHRALTENRAHLDRWLRWSGRIRTKPEVEAFIADFAAKETAGGGFHCGLWSDSTLFGGVICWYLDRVNRSCEIGYWLVESVLGRGLATRATAATIEHLLTGESIHRIEMQCGVANLRSRAIPERLGFRLEGIRRDSHWVTDRFVDHAIYGLLATDRSRLPCPEPTDQPPILTRHAG